MNYEKIKFNIEVSGFCNFIQSAVLTANKVAGKCK